MTAVPLYRVANMAAVTLRENSLYNLMYVRLTLFRNKNNERLYQNTKENFSMLSGQNLEVIPLILFQNSLNQTRPLPHLKTYSHKTCPCK